MAIYPGSGSQFLSVIEFKRQGGREKKETVAPTISKFKLPLSSSCYSDFQNSLSTCSVIAATIDGHFVVSFRSELLINIFTVFRDL